MHILVVWPRLDPYAAGSLRLRAFHRAWSEEGAHGEVVAHGDPAAPWPLDGVPGEHVRLFDALGDLPAVPAGVRTLRRRMRQKKPDVVVTSSPMVTVAAQALFAARKEDVPCIIDVRDLCTAQLRSITGPRLRHRALARLERWTYRHADALLLASPGYADWIRSHGWDHGTPMHTVLNGHEQPPRRRVPPKDARPIDVLFMGSILDPVVVRPFDVIKAMGHLGSRRPGTCFAFLGWKEASPMAGPMRAALAEAGVLGDTRLMPPVPPEEVPGILDQARTGIVALGDLPDLRPTLPVRTYTYMANGVPSAALGPADDTALRDLLETTGCGSYTEDVKGLVDALVGLLEDDTRWRRTSQAALKAAPGYSRLRWARRAFDEVVAPVARNRRQGER